MAIKLKIELTEHSLKKMVLKNLISSTINEEDYEGYFYLDQLGCPVFVVESKD